MIIIKARAFSPPAHEPRGPTKQLRAPRFLILEKTGTGYSPPKGYAETRLEMADEIFHPGGLRTLDGKWVEVGRAITCRPPTLPEW